MKKYNTNIFVFLVIMILITSCSNKLSNVEVTKLYLSALDSYSNQNFQEALSYLEIIKKYDSKFYQASFLEGKILFFQGQLDNALSVFQKITKKNPEHIESRIWHIRTLILLDKFEKAEELLEKELTFNQTDWRIYYLYSLLEERQGNMDQKILMLNRAEMVLTDSSKVYLELSNIWEILELQEKAYKYREKANIVSEQNISLQNIENLLID